MYKLYKGDCLELLKDIPDGSIDLIVCDPPYGVMKNFREEYKWDTAISPNILFPELSRILRLNGKCCLFCQEPYTSDLIKSAIGSLPFSYKAIWLKKASGNILNCKVSMVNYFEDILMFRKVYSLDTSDHPLLSYFCDELKKSGLTISDINKLLNVKSMASRYFTGGGQFSIPTKEKYEILQTTGFFNKSYAEIKAIDTEYKKHYSSIFNLWEGKGNKSNVLEYKKDPGGYHPTQKPVLLLEDLIKTFSNKGDTVLDFTMGSGSTGVACANTGRNFIGMELDNNYFKIAESRISEAFFNAKNN